MPLLKSVVEYSVFSDVSPEKDCIPMYVRELPIMYLYRALVLRAFIGLNLKWPTMREAMINLETNQMI